VIRFVKHAARLLAGFFMSEDRREKADSATGHGGNAERRKDPTERQSQGEPGASSRAADFLGDVLTFENVAAFCPAAEPYTPYLSLAAARYNIDTPLRLCHFLAQLAYESGGFTATRENLNYSVDALLGLFGRHRISERKARLYGRSDAHPANPTAIANNIYGGPWGADNLGNTEPGDGYRYIGRGLKQITGRYNYRQCSLALFSDLRLMNQPELLEQPEAACLSAGWYWDQRQLNSYADTDDGETITRRINGGLNGFDQRMQWLDKAKAVFV